MICWNYMELFNCVVMNTNDVLYLVSFTIVIQKMVRSERHWIFLFSSAHSITYINYIIAKLIIKNKISYVCKRPPANVYKITWCFLEFFLCTSSDWYYRNVFTIVWHPAIKTLRTLVNCLGDYYAWQQETRIHLLYFNNWNYSFVKGTVWLE